MAKFPIPLDVIAQQLAESAQGSKAATQFLRVHGIQPTGLESEEPPHNTTATPSAETESQAVQAKATEKKLWEGRERLNFSVLTVRSVEEAVLDSNYSPTDTPQYAEQKAKASAFTLNDDSPKPEHKTPATLTIENEAAVITRLLDALHTPQTSQKIAVKPLVQQVAQQHTLANIPRLTRAAQTCVFIYCDRSCHSYGIEQDALDIARALKQQLGTRTCRIFNVLNGPHSEWLEVTNRATAKQHTTSKALPLPDYAEAALVISGVSTASRTLWQPLLAHCQRNNAVCAWLFPQLASMNTDVLTHMPHAQLVNRLQQQGWQLLPWGKRATPTINTVHLNNALQQLTVFASTSRIMTGALLRELVHYLGLPAGVETLFWQQAEVYYQVGANVGKVVNPPSIEQAWLTQVSAEQLQAISAIFAQHLGAISQSAQHEQRIHLAALVKQQTNRYSESNDQPCWQPKQLAESQLFFERLGLTLQTDNHHKDLIAEFAASTLIQFESILPYTDVTTQQALAQTSLYLKQIHHVQRVPDALAEQVQALQQHQPQAQKLKQNLQLQQQGSSVQLLTAAEVVTEVVTEVGVTIANLPQFANDILLLKQLQTVEQTLQAAIANSTQNTQLLDASTPPLPTTIQRQHNLSFHNMQQFALQSSSHAIQLQQWLSDKLYWAKRLTVNNEGVRAETDFLTVFWPSDAKQPTDDEFSDAYRDDYSGAWLALKPKASAFLQQFRPQIDFYGLYQTVEVKGVNFKMRYIPAGSFLMGSPENEPDRGDDELQHPVTLTKAFWLGETTVTQELWQAIMGKNPSQFKAENNEQLPVEQVSWDDCMAFCKQLRHLTQQQWQLPTEAQWEYACRASTQSAFNTGEQLTSEQAHFDQGLPQGKTVDVHRYPANLWGVKQMHGNVREWCVGKRSKYRAKPEVDPVGATHSKQRAVLGGSWMNDGRRCRSAYRSDSRRDDRSSGIGFRLQGFSEVL